MMTRLVFLKFFAFCLFIFPLAACGAEKPDMLPTEKVKIVSAGRERANLTVELAISPKDQENGLMGRTSLPKDHGMLFIFRSNTVIRFWMKDTLIPLDMIFIDQDGRIVKIHENAKPRDETYISSNFQVRAVLELKGGAVQHYGLNMGDLVLSPTLDHMVAEMGAVSE